MNARFRALVALLLGACLLAAPAVAVAQPAAPGGEKSAVARYSSCLTEAGGGDLLLLLDESGSLDDTDPDDRRIAGAQYLLDRLAAFADREGVALDVAVAGFADRFTIGTGWTPLSGSTLPGLSGDVGGYADRDDGDYTDYWHALEGTRRTLADKAGGEQRCQAVAWFSDGRLDIDPAVTEPDRSLDAVCRGGGLADQLRSSGVVVLGIGLAVGGTPASDLAQMESIATGEGCGDVTDPRPGEFELATDLGQLLLAFDALAPGDPPIRQDRGICQNPGSCAEQAHRFVLDGLIDDVHVLGVVDVDGIGAEITAPSGAVVALADRTVGRDTQVDVDGVTLTYRWLSERDVEVDLVEPASGGGWPGVWALTFVDPASNSPAGVSTSSISISTEVRPALRGDPILTSGERVAIELGIVDRAGEPADVAEATGPVELSAVLRTADGTEVPIASGLAVGDLARPVELDLTDVAQGAATLSMTLSLATGPATAPDGTAVPGTRLADTLAEVDLEILPGIDLPTLGERVDFGSGDGVTELAGTLAVTGPGCVWLPADAAPELTGYPADAGRISITAPQAGGSDTCLVVPEGGSGELALQLRTEQVGNGTVSGTIPVSVAPLDDPDAAQTVTVAVTADLRKPINAANFWLTLIVALLLGPGIPLLLLFLAKRATAKIPEIGLAARRIPVTVDPSGRVLREGAPFTLDGRDLVNLVPLSPGGSRRLEVEGVVLRTRVGWSPFGPADVSVTGPPGAVLIAASDEPPEFRRNGREAVLPLAVHNHWVMLLDASGATSVLLLVGVDADESRRRRLGGDVAQRGGAALARARAAAEAGGVLASAPPPPYGGPGFPGAGIPGAAGPQAGAPFPGSGHGFPGAAPPGYPGAGSGGAGPTVGFPGAGAGAGPASSTTTVYPGTAGGPTTASGPAGGPPGFPGAGPSAFPGAGQGGSGFPGGPGGGPAAPGGFPGAPGPASPFPGVPGEPSGAGGTEPTAAFPGGSTVPEQSWPAPPPRYPAG